MVRCSPHMYTFCVADVSISYGMGVRPRLPLPSVLGLSCCWPEVQCFHHVQLAAGHAIAETASFKNTTARLTAAAGVQLGDLPPYDAHVLGGVNCVRGYDEGAMGTARHWAQMGAELESPQFWGRFSGVAFVDAGI